MKKLLGLGTTELVTLVGGAFVFFSVAGAMRKQSIVALVIQTWAATTQPTDAAGTYVRIEGRFPGFWPWLKALLGMRSAAGALRVDGRNVVFIDSAGTHVVPITSVSSLHHGYYRPLIPAIMTGLFTSALVFALSMIDSKKGNDSSMFIVAVMLGGVVAVIFYLLNKTLMLSVTEMGGQQWGFAFKGKKLDEEGAAQVIGIVQQLVNIRRYG